MIRSYKFNKGLMMDLHAHLEVLEKELNKTHAVLWEIKRAAWQRIDKIEPPQMTDILLCNQYQTSVGYYLAGSGWKYYLRNLEFPPTHWMYLPEKPY
jgi:hypothetical protein